MYIVGDERIYHDGIGKRLENAAIELGIRCLIVSISVGLFAQIEYANCVGLRESRESVRGPPIGRLKRKLASGVNREYLFDLSRVPIRDRSTDDESNR